MFWRIAPQRNPVKFFLCEIISSTLGSRTYKMFFALADPVILKPSCAALEMIAEVFRHLVESLGLAMVEGLRLGVENRRHTGAI